MYRPCDLDLWPMKVNIFLCIEYHPINILHKFQIDISSNSWEIKYQNIGRTHTQTDRHTHTHTHTHRQTDRQTGWKQYLATPSGGEVIKMCGCFNDYYVQFTCRGHSSRGLSYSRNLFMKDMVSTQFWEPAPIFSRICYDRIIKSYILIEGKSRYMKKQF